MVDSDVFLTRHGARIDKEDRHWLSKAGHHRRDDPQLSPAGHLGAAELAAKCHQLHQERPFAHIISSPFVRCVETALPVAKSLELPIKVEPGICEILTVFPPGFLDAEELQKDFGSIDLSYQPFLQRSQLRGESSDFQAAERAAKTARALREKLPGRILFVGHGASCLGIAGAFGREDYVGYTSLSHFVYDGTWRVKSFNAVEHLSDKETSLASAF
ncbi:unnamed protein product [Cladocopium goreaui]|uniref:Histidine phosphatase family protein n=1 Tax=Cladocopium goreaui TaxID=2562237 RepID=A0A9P1CFT9_9DINO|nr:unnamed protein product [Cladocopium goreaui]